MMIALFSLAVAGLCFLILYGIIQTKVKPQQDLSQRIRALDNMEAGSKKAKQPKPQQEKPSFNQRVMLPLRNTVGQWLTNMAPAAWSKALEHKLLLAGKARSWTVQGYALLWAASLVLGVLLGLKYVSNNPGLAVVQGLMVVVIFTALFGMIPWMLLRILIQKRQQMILRQLPEILDLLCVSVQAGLTFDAAMRRIIERMEGPLIDEFRRLLEDIRMGLPRRQAMRMLADRCEVQELTLFCTSLIQAERLGTSIGKTLTNQSANMRERHRQRIKAEAMKAPVKMLFPLVLFIFPALFVIVLLPSLLSLMENFGK